MRGGSGLSEDMRINTEDDIFCFGSRTKAVWLMGRAVFQLCNLTGYDEMAAWPMGIQ